MDPNLGFLNFQEFFDLYNIDYNIDNLHKIPECSVQVVLYKINHLVSIKHDFQF